VPIPVYIFTMADVLILSLTNHISLSLSPFGMLLNKAIRDVDYGFTPALAAFTSDDERQQPAEGLTDTQRQVITPYGDCEFKT
jgi:hypothetical protein